MPSEVSLVQNILSESGITAEPTTTPMNRYSQPSLIPRMSKRMVKGMREKLHMISDQFLIRLQYSMYSR